VITIKGSRRSYVNTANENIDIVCLSVSDNGVGMDENICKSFLTAESKGYGARNVNDRIRLFYGEEYHLEVKSIVGTGTTITIKFPVRLME
jgi:two-component system, sensor histidine kinase YesM